LSSDKKNIVHKQWMRSYAKVFGIAIPRGFRVNAAWGRSAETLCKRIQQHMRKPITGNFELWMVEPCKSADIRYNTWLIARSQIGVQERGGNNRGKEVEAYLASTGLGGGYPWCAAFTTWCLKNAGWNSSLPTYAAYVPSWEAWAQTKGYLIPFSKARTGDFVTYQFDNDAESDHIGVVTRRTPSHIHAIEGNTSNSNWADGDGVFERIREKKYVAKIIRVHY
jgi:hypothetical protein